MPYGQLTLEEREVISQMLFSGLGPTAIGRRLGRSPSTISRELRRNGSRDGYRAVSAQRRAQRRRRERPVSRKMDSATINAAVREGLAQEWSPEQIAGRLKREHPRDAARRVSHQTIYRWLETSGDREHFSSFLRHGKYRRRHGREREALRPDPAAVAAARAANRLRVLRIELPEHIPIGAAVPVLVAVCLQFKGVCDLKDYQPAAPAF